MKLSKKVKTKVLILCWIIMILMSIHDIMKANSFTIIPFGFDRVNVTSPSQSYSNLNFDRNNNLIILNIEDFKGLYTVDEIKFNANEANVSWISDFSSEDLELIILDANYKIVAKEDFNNTFNNISFPVISDTLYTIRIHGKLKKGYIEIEFK